ncbi:MAG: hypothetical protein LBQ68_09520 [Clostridiales bacterium]|jgi:hypothetical protein|nr:hypothetical protein [Clostridiales bacterium]
MPNQNGLTLNLVVSDALAVLEFNDKIFDAKRGDLFHFPNRQAENEANIKVGGVNFRLIYENATTVVSRRSRAKLIRFGFR